MHHCIEILNDAISKEKICYKLHQNCIKFDSKLAFHHNMMYREKALAFCKIQTYY